MDKENLISLEKILGFNFNNPSILLSAITHPSYAFEHPEEGIEHNERLEFLGDAVLELFISDYLFRTFPQKSEGDLTKLRSRLVCAESLYELAFKINLDKFLRLGKGEFKAGGNQRMSNLANAVEAVIGAVYFDCGIEAAFSFITRLYGEKLKPENLEQLPKDEKTTLQELLQKEKNNVLRYEILLEEGPPHQKIFTAGVIINDKLIATGRGKSKKEAEQEAAKKALELLKNEKEV
ncbi:ribonuclease III [Carboxydothermus hydrogenoformans]|uniref:Ribonuclease 3 n=1 Tax=Carboxydothermus hydrogenoformans (strain ATCC BAA-161 / DSM 6008 / Z-2901) TaxID=246194 RepID=RNC_CARHZ|nr:ribonuclease III [Carboxydothermus hydrogenoformans]Q3AC58.1 RecName: Full=Ribonuclease 3; AltName: Full=Ribonuclease III; Short=RNase III [Carboxydothermus hydrogenoformans Z-2901]ABB15325.1 ribonuclease III [Carboxydothermus hydrogenoformans Z-2901]